MGRGKPPHYKCCARVCAQRGCSLPRKNPSFPLFLFHSHPLPRPAPRGGRQARQGRAWHGRARPRANKVKLKNKRGGSDPLKAWRAPCIPPPRHPSPFTAGLAPQPTPCPDCLPRYLPLSPTHADTYTRGPGARIRKSPCSCVFRLRKAYAFQRRFS